jgi:RHS repeat-associated protein
VVLLQRLSVGTALLAGAVLVASATPESAPSALVAPPIRAGVCHEGPSGADAEVLDPAATVVDYAVSVTPKGGSAAWWTNTSNHPDTFTVTNTGNCPDTYSFSVSATGPITGITLNKTTASLNPGLSTKVVATYSVTTIGTGRLTLTASASIGGEDDSGFYNVNVTSPVISLDPHNGDYRDVTKCVASCFDAVAGYNTPPYVSWDTPRSVQLVYRSAQAKPMGLVQVDVRDTSHTNPVKLSIRLKDAQGAFVSFTNGATELFYTWTAHPADSNVNRLAAQFDASGLVTGAYNYTLVARTYRADASFTEYTNPIRVLVVNESTSSFGAGWSLSGFQHAYLQTGDSSLVITEGNGSIGYFARVSCAGGCTYAAPKGDFSAVTSVGTVGADSAKYYRRYPDGTTFAFRSDGRLWYVKDRLNNQIQFRYNAANLLAAIIDPAGKADSLSYNGSNKLRWTKDPGGRMDSITIDGSGNLTRIADWAGGVPFQGTYDANHRLTHWTDRRGGGWGLSYDFAGKLAADTAPAVTVNGQSARPVVKFASVEKTILIDPASGLGTSSSPGANVDTAIVRATTTNARGLSTTYGLDRFGAPNLVQEPLGRTTRFTRDSSSRIVRSLSPSGQIAKYTFSGPDLTQLWDSTTGRKINYVYESGYHQVTLVYGDVDSVVNRWTAGRLDSSRVGGSTAWTKYKYTSTGRDSIVTDPGGHTTIFVYHSTGFMNTDSTLLGVTQTGYQYDGHGQRTAVTHHFTVVGGQQMRFDTTRVQYDSIGRTIRVIGPLRDTTTTSYDALYATQVIDAKGQVYRTWPNALGWADSTKDPANAVDRYEFDSAGHRKSWTNRRGQTIQFTRDSLDQARFVIVGTDTTKFFAHPLGRFRTVSNRESVDTVKADTAGRPIWEISCRVLAGGSSAKCFRDSSAYHRRDFRVKLVARADSVWGVGVQRTVGWQYDSASSLKALTGFGGDSTTFGYNVELMMSGITLGGLNGLGVSYEYPWSHVTDIIQMSDSTVNASLGRSYNFDGGMRIEGRYHGSAGTPDWNRTYSYDMRGQLLGYVDSTHTYAPNGGCSRHFQGEECSGYQTSTWVGSGSYAYDSLGNRKDSATATGGIDPGNRLRRLKNLRMDYDAAGNLTVKRTLKPSDTTQVARRDSLFWSAIGLLDSVHTRDSLGVLTRHGYGYDGWGRRVRKTVGTVTARSLWDGGSLLMDLDSAGGRVAEYTYYPGADNPQSVLRHYSGADTTFYYVKDLPGNITGLVKRTGTGITIANQYDYTPFGEFTINSASAPNQLFYAAREFDTETQLYYNRARYYDATVGRFVSEDPAGLSAGMNLYIFAGNDPLNRRDPSGLVYKYSDPDGMNHRTWLLMRGRGASWPVPWGALLNTHGMLDDIAMRGMPTVDIYCDASGCQKRSVWESSSGLTASAWQQVGGVGGSAGLTIVSTLEDCNITGGGSDPNGPNCTRVRGVDDSSVLHWRCNKEALHFAIHAIEFGVEATLLIVDPASPLWVFLPASTLGLSNSGRAYAQCLGI